MDAWDELTVLLLCNVQWHVQYFGGKKSKISKRNLSCWMEALADKVHKQGELIPQHCYLSHLHSSMWHASWHNINIHCFLWRDGCLKCNMQCCGMCFPCLCTCTLSGSASFQPSLHLLDFILHVEILKFLVHLNTCTCKLFQLVLDVTTCRCISAIKSPCKC